RELECAVDRLACLLQYFGRERRKTVASYRRIEVKPIAGALGAEISNVDLSMLDDETFRQIEAAWLEHLVVFFRNQTLTPEQQIAFAKRFGEIHYHPFMKGMDEHPEIREVIKEEGDTRVFGEVWHTDQMFNPKPAKATRPAMLETARYSAGTTRQVLSKTAVTPATRRWQPRCATPATCRRNPRIRLCAPILRPAAKRST